VGVPTVGHQSEKTAELIDTNRDHLNLSRLSGVPHDLKLELATNTIEGLHEHTRGL
jgi:hypothetical protein